MQIIWRVSTFYIYMTCTSTVLNGENAIWKNMKLFHDTTHIAMMLSIISTEGFCLQNIKISPIMCNMSTIYLTEDSEMNVKHNWRKVVETRERLVQTHFGESLVGCHWHLSAWCWWWWNRTILPPALPCLWLEWLQHSVLLLPGPFRLRQSWWLLQMKSGNICEEILNW